MFSSVHSLHSEIAPHSSSLHLSSVTASTATPLYRQISEVWIRLRHISRSRSCLSINDFVSPTNSFSDSGARERNRMMHQAFLPRSLLYRSA
ncbi:hypothetical protein LINPERHAP2_LOCUS7434 [Linum perenne]